MFKLNNKGFAIASILYSIMVLFLLLLLSILGILGNRKAILDKNKKDILEEINSEILYNRINFEHKNITIINRGNLDDIRYALLDGVTAVDGSGNDIDVKKINYNLDLNNIENKSYYVTYTVDMEDKIITSTRQITFVSDSSDYTNNFDYTGDSQTFTPNYDGNYRVELWGAQGGNMTGEGFTSDNTSRGNLTYFGGQGAYTSGIMDLSKDQKIYMYVGGQGSSNKFSECIDGINGGYNGGGSIAEDQCKFGATGGGTTDIRITNGTWSNFDSLKSRIMVAAGGGGANFRNQGYGEGNGGSGGTLIGIDGSESLAVGSYHREDFTTGYAIGLGGQQTTGGMMKRVYLDGSIVTYKYGEFGYINANNVQSGGGSGYYAGGSSSHGGAGGGSSFISGYDGCDAIAENSTEDNIIHTGQSVHYSGYKFENAVMYAGNEEMPTHDGSSTMIGNSGNGYAKISVVYYWEENQFKEKYEATNLLVNSSFENEITEYNFVWDHTVDYSVDSTRAVYGSKSVKLTSKADNANIGLIGYIPVKEQHTYYVSAYILPYDFSHSPTIRIGYLNETVGYGTYISHRNKSDINHSQYFMKATYRYTNNTNSLYNSISIWNNTNYYTNQNEYFNVDAMLAIDLTETFGAGNEPSLEWCDENISYFEGTKIIYK